MIASRVGLPRRLDDKNQMLLGIQQDDYFHYSIDYATFIDRTYRKNGG